MAEQVESQKIAGLLKHYLGKAGALVSFNETELHNAQLSLAWLDKIESGELKVVRDGEQSQDQ